MTSDKVQAMRKALDEWERAKAWADRYAHEDVLGEYTAKLKLAEDNVRRAALALVQEAA